MTPIVVAITVKNKNAQDTTAYVTQQQLYGHISSSTTRAVLKVIICNNRDTIYEVCRRGG
jgi:hypothetical protein